MASKLDAICSKLRLNQKGTSAVRPSLKETETPPGGESAQPEVKNGLTASSDDQPEQEELAESVHSGKVSPSGTHENTPTRSLISELHAKTSSSRRKSKKPRSIPSVVAVNNGYDEEEDEEGHPLAVGESLEDGRLMIDIDEFDEQDAMETDSAGDEVHGDQKCAGVNGNGTSGGSGDTSLSGRRGRKDTAGRSQKRDSDGLPKEADLAALRFSGMFSGASGLKLGSADQAAAAMSAMGDNAQGMPNSATMAYYNMLMAAAAANSGASGDPWAVAQATAVSLANATAAGGAANLSNLQRKPGKGNLNSSPFGEEKKKGSQFDYTKYIKKYSSATECMTQHCLEMSYREHYHCLDCSLKIFVKKEEMTRHYKWHKKREESLQHGFMRYSPFDDCTVKFGPCTHNHKQTHYHCIQPGCNKVYISTSDVQMHATYHRKAIAIEMEGFQRFRATEGCGVPTCSFYTMRTTHFHCMRPGCSFTFKNKAEMEKHKTYHQKDLALSKDGFKKFMKYEHCNFENCPYSNVSNHTHCIRPGCGYVLPSSSQLHSHKKKHEKKEFEQAFKRFKDAQGIPIPRLDQPPTMIDNFMDLKNTPIVSPAFLEAARNLPVSAASLYKPGIGQIQSVASPNTATPTSVSQGRSSPFTESPQLSPSAPASASGSAVSLGGLAGLSSSQLDSSLNLTVPSSQLDSSLNLTVPSTSGITALTSRASELANDLSVQMASPRGAVINGLKVNNSTATSSNTKDELWKKYLTRFTANDHCRAHCSLLYKDHYHCNMPGCTASLKSKECVREHARNHDNQERMTTLLFNTSPEGHACPEKGCTMGAKLHFHCKFMGCPRVITMDDDVFSRLHHHREHETGRRVPATGAGRRPPRRRGRPPKYLKEDLPEVPRPDHENSPRAQFNQELMYALFEEDVSCPDVLCEFQGRKHYHCTQPRCYHASDRTDVVGLHSKDFHAYINISEGFQFYDRTVDCRRVHCQNNKTTKHFHCIRPRCDYTFVRHTTMYQHDRKHAGTAVSLTNSGSEKSFKMTEEVSAGVAKAAVKAEPQGEIIQEVTDVDKDQISGAQSNDEAQTSPKATIKSSGTFFPQNTLGNASVGASGDAVDLMSLVQQRSSNVTGQADSNPDLAKIPKMVTVDQPCYSLTNPCGRPFCKLKRKQHFHCAKCDHAFSEATALAKHMIKHSKQLKSASDDVRLAVSNFLTAVKQPSQISKSTAPSGVGSSENGGGEATAVIKKEGLKDCEGYAGFLANEECGFQRCTFRKKVNHYHCMREQCVRALADDVDLLEEHSKRHEQLEQVLGKEFKVYRAHVDCSRSDCEFSKKSTHFHCLLCPFICTDASKITIHKKNH